MSFDFLSFYDEMEELEEIEESAESPESDSPMSDLLEFSNMNGEAVFSLPNDHEITVTLRVDEIGKILAEALITVMQGRVAGPKNQLPSGKTMGEFVSEYIALMGKLSNALTLANEAYKEESNPVASENAHAVKNTTD